MPPKAPMIPIKRDEDASSYRYKMPKLISRPLSSGNGVKTTIVNSSDIAKAISRTQAVLTQWFGYHLACQARISTQSSQIVLNGDHQTKKLQDSLYEFIDNFVLCPSCLNPETAMDKKGNNLVLHCHACGHTEVACQGSRSSYVQRTIDWILGHLQTETKQSTRGLTQKTKGRIDEIDDYHKEKAKEVEEGGAGVAIDVDELKKIETELEAKEQKVKLTEQEENDYIKKLTTELAGDGPDLPIYEEFIKIADLGKWSTLTRLNIIISSLFNGAKKELLDILIKRRGFLIRILSDDGLQCNFLQFIAKYIEKENPELLTSAPIIWYTLYQNEIIEESGFQKFSQTKVSKRFEDSAKAKELRKLIAPFYDWLEKTDFEPKPESSDSEDEKPQAAAPPKPAQKQPEPDDINIDDI